MGRRKGRTWSRRRTRRVQTGPVAHASVRLAIREPRAGGSVIRDGRETVVDGPCSIGRAD